MVVINEKPSHQILCIFYFLIMIFFSNSHVIFYIFAIKHEYNSFFLGFHRSKNI